MNFLKEKGSKNFKGLFQIQLFEKEMENKNFYNNIFCLY